MLFFGRLGARNNVITVNTTYEYRLTLGLDDFETSVFTNAVNTDAGRMERLQVLGLFKRPINYHKANECLQFVWPYFKTEIFTLATDALAETKLAQEVRSFVVEGGVLPGKGAFKKIRFPGDYPVLYRKGDPEEAGEPQYTLGGGDDGSHLNRYKVEQGFWNANPALGQIPIVATVERRAKGTTGPWAAAPGGISVYFRLEKPDDPPQYSPYTGSTVVAGARSFVSSVAAPPLRSKITQRAENQSKTDPKGTPGPAGYLKRHISNYPNKIRKSDPQQCNAHFHLGGKFQMAANVKDVSSNQNAGAFTRRGIFAKSLMHAAPVPLDLNNKKERARHGYSVNVPTDAHGKAGVLFQPSRIGGDRYKLSAYVYENAKYYKVETGTMVVWRTVRVSRDIVADAPTAVGELPNDLTAGLANFQNQCSHSQQVKFCNACLIREQAVPPAQFSTYFTTELAKAYCELLLEPKAENPLTTTGAEVQNDINRYLLPILNTPAINQLRVTSGEWLTITDGVMHTFNNLQSRLRNFEPGSVRITIADFQTVDDSNGNFPAELAKNFTGGTVNYAAGTITLNFAVAPPADRKVELVCTALNQIDFGTLLYFPNKSPWLFTLRTPEDYNTRVAVAGLFPPIPVLGEIDTVIGNPDGNTSQYQGNVYPIGGGVKPRLKLYQGATEIGKDEALGMTFKASGAVKFFSRIDYFTGAVTVVRRQEHTENVANGDGVQTTFVHNTAHPILSSLAGAADVTMLIKLNDTDLARVVRQNTLLGPVGMLPIAAPLAGGSVTIAGNTVTIQFATAPPVGQTISILYSSSQNFDAIGNLSVKGSVDLPDVRTAAGLNKRIEPSAEYTGTITKLVNEVLLMAVGRAIADNKGYMPGLISIRIAGRDTWTTLYTDQINEGKGICHTFLMFMGTKTSADGRNPYEVIAFHEMGHTLYLNHYNSASASVPRDDLHDMWDNCLMGYAKSEKDLCGQCIASYMGMNVNDPRFLTSVGGVFQMPDKAKFNSPVSG